MREGALATIIFLLACTAPAIPEPVDPLEDSWDNILHQATLEGKYIYLAFLGDGWSVASSRFLKEVLESGTFKAFADRRLIYCPVLARSNPPMGKERTARLQALVIHFDMKAYPAFILMAPDGSELLRHGYRALSAEEYVRLLETILPGSPKGVPPMESVRE